MTNKSKWDDFQSKIDIFHEEEDIEQERQLKIRQSNAGQEESKQNTNFANQINQLLTRAKKLQKTPTLGNKMVIVRPEAKNCDKSLSIVRIRDPAKVKLF